MEPSKSAIAPANTSIPVTSTTEKKDDREILAEAIASVVNRINESFSRLTKVEKQLNLHPRNVQDYPDSVKQFDILFPSLATLLNVAKQTKLKLVLYQIELFANAIVATRELLTSAQSHRKPNESVFAPIFNFVSAITHVSTTDVDKLDSSVVNILTSIANAAQALKWVPSSTPLSVVTDAKNAFLKDKSADSGPCPTLDIVEKILTDIESYLDIHHKSGIEWKGTKDLNSLVWFNQGSQAGNIANGSRSKHASTSDVWVSEYLSKSHDHESSDGQQLNVLFASQATLNITGKASTLSIDHCSFSTVNIANVESVTISNSDNLKVICPTATEVKVERSVNCHVTTSSSAELIAFCAPGLKVEAEDNQVAEVPGGIKIKAAKGGKVTTSVVPEAN